MKHLVFESEPKDSIASYLEWDSDFFGFNVATIVKPELEKSELVPLKKFVTENNIKLLTFASSISDRNTILAAESYGFSLVDVRLTFNLSLLKNESHTSEDSSLETCIQRACVEDAGELAIIAMDSYISSRYYFDGQFDENKLKEFYGGWVIKAITGDYDDECWVIRLKNEIMAYCTIRYEGSQSFIGLVGVSPSHTSQGWGKKLLSGVIFMLKRKGVSEISVVTQARNIAAQNLYSSVGFKVAKTEVWYHKWF